MRCNWCGEIHPDELIMYRVGPTKTRAGVVLSGGYCIGHWIIGREGNYINGVPDAHDMITDLTYQQGRRKLKELQEITQ